ncbi:hypothetical protein OFC51_32560, partial [Escherichia coli]|nr:hypothetical protein [Escherichia coli]
ELVARALASNVVEIDNQPETALSAKRVDFPGGQRFVLIVRWEKPRFTPFFGESPLRYLRYTAVLLTAILLCWILARYLASPISKIRE